MISNQNEVAVKKTWIKTAILPILYLDKKQFKNEQELAKNVAMIVKSIISSNFVLNFLLYQSMEKLWCTMNILQLLLDIGLLDSIILPSNSQTLFLALNDITQFDLLDSESITDYIFKRQSFSDVMLDPLSDRLALSSY